MVTVTKVPFFTVGKTGEMAVFKVVVAFSLFAVIVTAFAAPLTAAPAVNDDVLVVIVEGVADGEVDATGVGERTGVGDGEGVAITIGVGDGVGVAITVGVSDGFGVAVALSLTDGIGANPPPPPNPPPPKLPPPVFAEGSGVAVTLAEADGNTVGTEIAVGEAVIVIAVEREDAGPDPTALAADTRAANDPIVRSTNVYTRFARSVIVLTTASTPSLTSVSV